MLLIFAATSVCAAITFCPGLVVEQPAMGQVSTVSASSDPFIGKWKLNPSRSHAADEMKVSSAGENKYAFDLGGGHLETIVADGTDQPGEFGTTLAVSVAGPNSWRVVRKNGGHTMIDATWELSADGSTLTDHFGFVQADGSVKRTDYIYKRTAGHAGFAGTWEDTTPPSASEMQIESYEGNGLSFLNLGQKTTKSVKFDGKEYPVTGGNLPAGYVSSGRRVNAHTVQLAEKIGGKPLDTQQAEVSADSKTLTMTVTPAGKDKPRIYVFERE
jgi:hypothetical protein